MSALFPHLDEKVPDPDLKQFHWGAFLMPVFFGLQFKPWFAALAFICKATVVLSPIPMIVGGIYGRRWAWRSGDFRTEADRDRDTSGLIMTGLILNFIGIVILVWWRGLSQVAWGCLIMGGTFVGIAFFMGIWFLIVRPSLSFARRVLADSFSKDDWFKVATILAIILGAGIIAASMHWK